MNSVKQRHPPDYWFHLHVPASAAVLAQHFLVDASVEALALVVEWRLFDGIQRRRISSRVKTFLPKCDSLEIAQRQIDATELPGDFFAVSVNGLGSEGTSNVGNGGGGGG